MPRVKTQVARADIYHHGLKKVDENTKSGYRIDRSKPRNEEDTIHIPKGKTYYKWSFRYGGTHRSLVRPRASQLTQSNFLSQAYGFIEQIEDFVGHKVEDISEFVVNLKEEVETLREETQQSLENMPEQLQYAPTGELLQERIDSLESFENELSELEDMETEDCQVEMDNEIVDEEERASSYDDDIADFNETVENNYEEKLEELNNIYLEL